MSERSPDQSKNQSIYTINVELLQIIALDAVSRKLSNRELEEVKKTIKESIYSHLVDCIVSALRFRNSELILENDKLRGHSLMPEQVRHILPPLYSNETKGLQA